MPTFADRKLMTDRPEIYIFARMTDRSREWTGKNFVTVKGREFGFRAAAVDQRLNGDYAVRLSCDDPTPTPSTTE